MSGPRARYFLVEHIWRALRSGAMLLGTAIWLYFPEAPNLAVLTCFAAAAIIDQLHGLICHALEKLLNFEEQHHDYE